MTSSPHISVVMPVYNGERHLEAAVQSILEQSFGDFEFVIVNDGSTDQSPAILNRFSDQDARLRVISRPNTGIVGALNDGLRAARGKLIARMDADDVAHADRFEKQVAFLDSRPDCIGVGSAIRMIDNDGDPIRTLEWECDSEAIRRNLMQGTGGIAHPTAMLDRQSVLRAGLYRSETQYAEDLDLWLRLSEIGNLANIPSPLLDYRMHAGSICATRRQEILAAIHVAVTDAHRRRSLPLPEQSTPQPSSVPIYESAVRLVGNSILGGNFATARKHAKNNFIENPTSAKSWVLLSAAFGGVASQAVAKLGYSIRQRQISRAPESSPPLHEAMETHSKAA